LFQQIQSGIHFLILAIGVFGIKKWDRNVLLATCFVVNILLQLPDLALVQDRQGIDVKAYINQAG